ncbi:hypothetical protein, partial [Bradyrhizobium sp.]|uniref:hypothetical protein n=1 Tax=Bradyrhizobium sp. TaxID=376 RepID=UPI003C336FD2
PYLLFEIRIRIRRLGRAHLRRAHRAIKKNWARVIDSCNRSIALMTSSYSYGLIDGHFAPDRDRRALLF